MLSSLVLKISTFVEHKKIHCFRQLVTSSHIQMCPSAAQRFASQRSVATAGASPPRRELLLSWAAGEMRAGARGKKKNRVR